MIRMTWMPLALAGAIALTGCGQTPGMSARAPVPATQPGAAVMAEEVRDVDYRLTADAPAGYSVMNTAAADAVLAVRRVDASSTRNTYFPASHVLDGNVSSAWSPAATDTAPTLTLSLDRPARLGGVAIKMSHANVTVDLAVRTAGGTWKTVATGLAPVSATLSELEVDAVHADEVRLTFRGADVAELLVCEVQAFGAATVAPTPTPSVSPVPTPTPTQPPQSNEPCVSAGGGWVPVEDHRGRHKITFAYMLEGDEQACTGTVVVENLTLKQRYRGVVTKLVGRGNFVTFSGRLEDGTPFTCTVVEGGRHGKRDSFAFATATGLLFCGPLVQKNGVGGAIKVKRKHHGDAWFGEDEARGVLVPLGMGVVRVHDRYEFDLDRFNERCEREDDDGEAVGRRKHRDKDHGKHGRGDRDD